MTENQKDVLTMILNSYVKKFEKDLDVIANDFDIEICFNIQILAQEKGV